MSAARAVFLDRDGTLMEEVHYCGDPAKVKVFPGVPEALRRLKAAGFRTFVITNQSGIGRGLITEAQYRAVQDEALRQLGQGTIDASYFCPDAPGVPSTPPGRSRSTARGTGSRTTRRVSWPATSRSSTGSSTTRGSA
jgi:D-glycero-D-manno-heptose 1,7-bisphosphate phosphatase